MTLEYSCVNNLFGARIGRIGNEVKFFSGPATVK